MKHRNNCECDWCMGACDEANPTCGDCFLCEAKADDDKWWAVNRADIAYDYPFQAVVNSNEGMQFAEY